MNKMGMSCVVAVLLLSLGLLGELDYQEEILQTEFYCKMVTAFETSERQVGWPPFKGKNIC